MNFKSILFHVEPIGDLTPNLFSFFFFEFERYPNKLTTLSLWWRRSRFFLFFPFLSIDSFLCTRLTNGIKSRELVTLAPSFGWGRPTSGAVRDLGRWGYYTTRLSYMVTLFAPLPFHGLVSAHQPIQHTHTHIHRRTEVLFTFFCVCFFGETVLSL
jgi:hypothetical protein